MEAHAMEVTVKIEVIVRIEVKVDLVKVLGGVLLLIKILNLLP